MKTLAIDTALGACSVAVTLDGVCVSKISEKRLRGHAEQLLPMVENALVEAKLEYSELDLLAVTVGPGTFTGLRIGLAAVRAVAIASGKPAIGVTTLEVLAASVMKAQPTEIPLFVAIDARRNEIFLQQFDISGRRSHLPLPIIEPKSIPVDQIATYMNMGSALVVGSGASIILEKSFVNLQDVKIAEMDPDPDPILVGRIGEEKYAVEAPTGPPQPVYLRAPDAKLPGGIDPFKRLQNK